MNKLNYFHFEALNEGDFGEYMCVAHNSLGTSKRNIMLSGLLKVSFIV